MKQIELVSGIKSSVLGFGCAPIMGSVGGNKAKRALDCAIDNGITHFDIARSYGYGEAEKFVGRHLKAKRKDIIIASKAGIKANFKAKLMGPIKPIIRYGLSKLKKNTPAAPAPLQETNNTAQIADSFHYRITLNASELRKSLEESLKALGTDYLDYFFIHEPFHMLENIEELADCANKFKEEGKIKAWGLAFMMNQKHLHTTYINKFDLLQFNNSPGMEGYQNIINERSTSSNIFFSPLRGGDMDMKPAEKLKKLSADFQKSVILCSMFNEKHLISNAKLFM